MARPSDFNDRCYLYRKVPTAATISTIVDASLKVVHRRWRDDRQAFLEVTLANLPVGNTGNHTKKQALLYTGPRPVLARIHREVTHQLGGQHMEFDVVSTLQYCCLAMKHTQAG